MTSKKPRGEPIAAAVWAVAAVMSLAVNIYALSIPLDPSAAHQRPAPLRIGERATK